MIVLLIAALLSGFSAISPATATPKAPKNIIIMISDGWGYNHIDATSYYMYGKTGRQAYAQFSFKAGMSTYECEAANPDCVLYGYDPGLAWSDFEYVKSNATDSASAATAMSTGSKTYNGAIGVDVYRQPLKHALELAEEKGKATGVVTSVEFSHATPAGFVAHNVTRNDYAGIANEMIYSSAADLIMGCGAPDYDNSGNPQDPTDRERYVGGPATWADITDDFRVTGADANGDGNPDEWVVVRERSDFQAMAKGETPARVLGIPYVYTTLQQARSGDGYADPYDVPFIESVPTLEEMTKAALNVLDNDPDGVFLMIEGGAVDWAGHANQSGRLIEEQVDFDNAVRAVVRWVKKNSNWGETLLIVTGDHETGYLNGPGSDPSWQPIVNNGAGVLPGMEWHSGDHTNSLIPFFAKGDGAHWFNQYASLSDPVRGAYLDNTNIAHVVFQLLEGN